jgi:hypothetical protein
LAWASQAQREADYGKIPLTFEANQGQTDARVRYLARGAGYTVFLTPGEAVLRLARRSDHGVKGAVLRMRMAGAATSPEIQPEGPVGTQSSYFIGSDPKAWRSGVPQFARVRYRNVYEGIDAVYYGNQRQLEYDLVVAPGADPSVIRFAVDGARKMRIDAAGNLVISTLGGDLVEHRPVIYQESGGTRTAVSGRYRVKSGKYFLFAIGDYDKSRPLYIDPALSYATYLGGTGDDIATALAVDTAGNAFVTGTSTSIDFPTAAGSYDQACGTDGNCNSGNTDIFLAKLNPAGTALVYSTYIGGNSRDSVSQVLVDGSGNAYLVGQSSSTDFPITPGAFNSTSNGQNSNFLLKLNASGTALAYSTYTFGTGGLLTCALGPGGTVYLAGSRYYSGAYGPTTPGAFQQTVHNDGVDGYVARLNAAGTALDFGTYVGGSGWESITALSVDSAGNAVIAGTTTSLDFPVTPGVFQPAFPTGATSSAFLAKLNATGSALVFATYGPGPNNATPTSLLLDQSDNIYVATGAQSGTVTKVDSSGGSVVFSHPNPGYQLFLNASNEVFLVGSQTVQKVTPTGIVPVFTTSIPAPCCNLAMLDRSGNLYVVGSDYFISANLATPGALQQTSRGGADIVVAKITPGGGSLRSVPSQITAIIATSGVVYGYLGKAAWVYSDGSPYPVYVPVTAVASDSSWASLPAPWLLSAGLPVSRLDASAPNLSVNVSGLATPGAYNATITVASPGAGNSLGIPVSLTVTDLPYAEFSISPALTFQYTIGGPMPAVQTEGLQCPNGNTTFTVVPSGGTWLGVSPQSGSNCTSLTVTADPTGLAAGSYLATLDLKTPGMPTVQLPVRMIVSSAALATSPAALAFTQVKGQPAPAAQNLSVSGATGSYSATVSGGGTWLSISATSGSLPGQISVSVNPAGLQPGTYRTTIAVSGPAGTNAVSVPVTYVIAPPNTITLSVSSLAFSSWPGATPTAQSVSISSEPSLNWTAFATSTGNWLAVSPTGGGTPGTLSVSVNPTGLATGNYTGSISVVAPGADNSPQTISVTLAVTASQPVTVTPATLSFTTSPGVSPASQALAISSGSGKSFTASASSTGNWLSVSPTSGAMPGSLTVGVNPGSLSVGSYSGTISVYVTQQDNSVVTATIPITLSVIAKNVMHLSPTSIDVTSWSGAGIPQKTVTVSMDSSAWWSCSSSVTWVSCYQSGTNALAVTFNSGNLPSGQYAGTITVSSSAASNGPQTLTVNLTVLSSAPVTVLPPGPMTFTSVNGAAPAAQTLSLSGSVRSQ